ncbi:MAG: hypothetical protein VKK59_03725 [Vampirovibrionales bacterium]|nr:hypothetical protein [Vampirovibrionales bacterium]
MPNRLKKPIFETGKHIRASESSSGLPQLDYPVFCFKHLDQDEYGIKKCDKNELALIIKCLERLSKLTWVEIQLAGVKGMGSEVIPKDQLGKQLPRHFTGDVTTIRIRFGNKKAMIGVRDGALFHVLFLDPKFTLYDHG